MDKIKEIFIEKKQIIKRINFLLPIPFHQDEIKFNFHSDLNKQDFLKFYEITEDERLSMKLIDNLFLSASIINENLSTLKKKLINENYQSLNDLWDYISLLHYTRKIFLNNNSNFTYTQEGNESILSSSSLDFEYCISLYIMASKQQECLKESSKDVEVLKWKVSNLIIAERCFEEAFLTAKNCENNINKGIVSIEKTIDNTIQPFDIFLKNSKRFVINLQTQSIGSEDVQNVMLKSNLSILNKWIQDDFGGIDLMKSRSKIAYCQSNESYFKAIKYLVKINEDVPKLSLAEIAYNNGLSYSSIYNKNGPLQNEIYNENFNRIFSKFMSKYWFFKSHSIFFILNTEKYITPSDDYIDEFIENQQSIEIENSRFLLLTKYQKNLIKLNNNNLFDYYIQKINKVFEQCESIYKKLDVRIKEFPKLNIIHTDDNFKIIKSTTKTLNCSNIAKLLHFNDFINNSLKRILQNNPKTKNEIQSFLNITTNTLFDFNQPVTKEEFTLEKYREPFRNALKELTEKNQSILSNKHQREIFEKGMIQERVKWIQYFFNLIKNNNKFIDSDISNKIVEDNMIAVINYVDKI
jgi:hypothetical protein